MKQIFLTSKLFFIPQKTDGARKFLINSFYFLLNNAITKKKMFQDDL